MTFTYDTRKEAFISKYGLEIKETDAEGNVTKRTDLTAQEAFQALRKKYKLDEDENKKPIPEEERLSDREARKIFVVREEIKNIEFNKYLPAPSPPMSVTRRSHISRKWAVS